MGRRREYENGEYLGAVRRMLRCAATRVAEGGPEDLAELVGLRADLDEAIGRAVDGLRASGVTWQSIGDATGTTKQAAIGKWSRRTVTA